MAKNQTVEQEIKKTRQVNAAHNKKHKVRKAKVFSFGFISLSLVLAVVIFFTLFFIGIQVGPSLGI